MAKTWLHNKPRIRYPGKPSYQVICDLCGIRYYAYETVMQRVSLLNNSETRVVCKVCQPDILNPQEILKVRKETLMRKTKKVRPDPTIVSVVTPFDASQSRNLY